MSLRQYGQHHVEQDLRRLNDAALDLLWRLDPQAITAIEIPQWIPRLLSDGASRAASDLMAKLLVILDLANNIKVAGHKKNWTIPQGTVRKTGYLCRYIADDLLDLTHALDRLALRLNAPECRKIGPELLEMRLAWLAENVVAHAEPILVALNENPDVGRNDHCLRPRQTRRAGRPRQSAQTA
jgi:hypothetical protein